MLLTKRDRKRYRKGCVERDTERLREKETDIQTDCHRHHHHASLTKIDNKTSTDIQTDMYTVTADRQIDRQNDR